MMARAGRRQGPSIRRSLFGDAILRVRREKGVSWVTFEHPPLPGFHDREVIVDGRPVVRRVVDVRDIEKVSGGRLKYSTVYGRVHEKRPDGSHRVPNGPRGGGHTTYLEEKLVRTLLDRDHAKAIRGRRVNLEGKARTLGQHIEETLLQLHPENFKVADAHRDRVMQRAFEEWLSFPVHKD